MSLLSETLAFDRAPLPPPLALHERELLAFDRGSVRSTDVDGRLHVDVCNISKAAVNPYYGREIPNGDALGLDPTRKYLLYRDPVELEKAAPTFMRLQLLDTHVAVNAADPKKQNWIGSLGSDVRFEAPYLKASLTVHDASAITDILAKRKAELSCSYRYRADMTPGISPEGVAYDGIMRDIIGNHVALVREGRAGPDVFVNDSLPIGMNMHKYPKILAVVGSVIAGLTDSQKLALDQAFDKKAKDEEEDKEAANDAKECSLDEREEAMDASESEKDTEKKDEVARGDRKKARDSRKAARDKRASDRKTAKDARAKDAVIEPEGSKKEVEIHGTGGRKAADSVTPDQMKAAVDAAIAGERAYETAKREVAPLVGPITVAMDSAEAVYRFALDRVKVAHKDIPAAALAAIVSAEIRARKATPTLASDTVQSEYTIESIFGAK